MKIITVCLLLVASSYCSNSTHHEVSSLNYRDTPDGRPVVPLKQDKRGEDKATMLVLRLQSADESDRVQAKGALRAFAGQSAESRKQVIRESIKLVEESDPSQRLTSEAHYDAWSFATELLGELKATEALDALIACINCNDGIGGLSSDRFPAFKAITMIGSESVTKLIAALSDKRPTTRSYAALALGEIGGTEAKKSLEQALLSEHDKDVVVSIRIALRQQ
jgi:HEAT repeat protein